MRYSSSVRRLLLDPKNGKKSAHYNAKGEHESKETCPTNPGRTNTYRVLILFYIEDNTIKDARYEAFGDPVVLAASAWCVQEVVGMRTADAYPLLSAANLAEVLDTSWDSGLARGCLTVSIAALSALNSYEDNNLPPA